MTSLANHRPFHHVHLVLVARVCAEEVQTTCLLFEGRGHLNVILSEDTLPELRPRLWRVAEHETIGSRRVPDARRFLGAVNAYEHRSRLRREDACEFASDLGLRFLIEDVEESTAINTSDMTSDIV